KLLFLRLKSLEVWREKQFQNDMQAATGSALFVECKLGDLLNIDESQFSLDSLESLYECFVREQMGPIVLLSSVAATLMVNAMLYCLGSFMDRAKDREDFYASRLRDRHVKSRHVATILLPSVPGANAAAAAAAATAAVAGGNRTGGQISGSSQEQILRDG
ncbi:hypothetical protein BOX15_Mlig002751g4, partial [Macrostomum lignano]